MIHFTVTFEGLDELEHRWEDAQRDLHSDLHTVVNHAVHAGAAEARDHHTFVNRSYVLEDSIEGRILSSSAGRTEGEMVAEAPYASYVENGTRPHTIRARGTALRWMDGDRPVFAKVVQHPGSKAYPFMRRAAKLAERLLQRGAGAAVTLLVSRMNRR